MQMQEILAVLDVGDPNQLERLRERIDEFPLGSDSEYGEPWLFHAIERGCIKTLQWMIGKGVSLHGRDIGYPVLHACIESDAPNKQQVLALLVHSGADLNSRGPNDWTPLHLAAVRNDVWAVEYLLEAGADASVRTRIDNCFTAEQEAEMLGSLDAARSIGRFRQR